MLVILKYSSVIVELMNKGKLFIGHFSGNDSTAAVIYLGNSPQIRIILWVSSGLHAATPYV